MLRVDTKCNCHKLVVAPIINLQVASGLMSFAGSISRVIAGWCVAGWGMAGWVIAGWGMAGWVVAGWGMAG